jgi:hypothetical protein
LIDPAKFPKFLSPKKLCVSRRTSKDGGGGAGKLLPPAEAKASKAEARVRRWHSPVVARLSSWQLTQES